MRAWQVKSVDADGLELADLEGPAGGLVIEVEAAGVGFPDLLMRHGQFQIAQPPPFTLGWEAAGIVVGAPAHSHFAVGDAVVTMSFGAFAQRVRADPSSTFPLPPGLTFHEGAALPLNYLTALAGLQVRGRLQRGERVLVHGAGGGAGSAAVQVAKGLGAEVVAVVSTPSKADVARTAGADHVVALSDGWAHEVREVAGGGVEVVFDPVGGDRFKDSLRCLVSQGRYVVVGFASGEIPTVAANRLLLRNVDLCGCTWSVLADRPDGLTEAGRTIDTLVQQRFVKPQIGQLFPFDRLPDALRAIEERQAEGKLVLDLA